MSIRLKAIISLVTCVILLALATVTVAATNGNGSGDAIPSALLNSIRLHVSELADELDIGDDAGQGAPGTLDDGEDLLPQAQITIDEAIAAAKRAHAGSVGEIDLEHYEGKLVFNVDVGDRDVKVDAKVGTVIGSESDD